MSATGRLQRGELYIEPTGQDGGDLVFVLHDGRAGVVLTPEELRWLVALAGPAMLARHAPLPTAAEELRRRIGSRDVAGL